MKVNSDVNHITQSPSYDKIDSDSNCSNSRRSFKNQNPERAYKQEKQYFEKNYKRNNQNEQVPYYQNTEGKNWENENSFSKQNKENKKKSRKKLNDQTDDLNKHQTKTKFNNNQNQQEAFTREVNNSNKLNGYQKIIQKNENVNTNIKQNETENNFQNVNSNSTNNSYVNHQTLQNKIFQNNNQNPNLFPHQNNNYKKKYNNNLNSSYSANFDHKNNLVNNYQNNQFQLNSNIPNYQQNFQAKPNPIVNNNAHSNQHFHTQSTECAPSLFKPYERLDNNPNLKKNEQNEDNNEQEAHPEITENVKFMPEETHAPSNFNNSENDWKAGNNNPQIYMNINKPEIPFVFQHNILNNNNFVNIQQPVLKNMPFHPHNSLFRQNLNYSNNPPNINNFHTNQNFQQNNGIPFSDIPYNNWDPNKMVGHTQNSYFNPNQQKAANQKFKGNNEMRNHQMNYNQINTMNNPQMNKNLRNNFNNGKHNQNNSQFNHKQNQIFYGNFPPNLQRPSSNFNQYQNQFNYDPNPHSINNFNNSQNFRSANPPVHQKINSDKLVHQFNSNIRNIQDHENKTENMYENEEKVEYFKEDLSHFRERKHSNTNLINITSIEQRNKYKNNQNKYNILNSYSENFSENPKKNEKVIGMNQNYQMNKRNLYAKTHSFNLSTASSNYDFNSSYFGNTSYAQNDGQDVFGLKIKLEDGITILFLKTTDNIDISIRNFLSKNGMDIELARGLTVKAIQAMEIWRNLKNQEIPECLENLIDFSFRNIENEIITDDEVNDKKIRNKSV